jgi:hypothetical protein
VLRKGLAWFVLLGAVASFVWSSLDESGDPPVAFAVLIVCVGLAALALSALVIMESAGARSVAGKLFSLAVIGIPLVGLAVMGEWLGLALVLALVPVAGGRPDPTRWPLPAQLAFSAFTWGILMEGFLTVMEGRGYDVVSALILAAIMGAFLTLFYLWDLLRSRRKPA